MLLHSCVSISSSYKPCFPFLGSFDRNSSLGSASILAFLRQSPSAWPGILKPVLQRGWAGGCGGWRGVCVCVCVSHIGPLPPHMCFQHPGILRGASAPLVLGRVWGALWAQSCELGHWKTPPFQRLFTALGKEQGKRQLLRKASLL